jgi:hypothetical protein
MKVLASSFSDVKQDIIAPEIARDRVRSLLHHKYPALFPYGSTGTSIATLANYLFKTNYILMSNDVYCTNCNYSYHAGNSCAQFVFECIPTFQGHTSSYIDQLLVQQQDECHHCYSPLKCVSKFIQIPPFIIVVINNARLRISKQMKFVDNDRKNVYTLRGIIYLGNFHFTSRIITSDNIVWYHDGIETKNICIREDTLQILNYDELQQCNGRNATLLVYALKIAK